MSRRVLIVDDEPPARRRLARLLASAGADVIGEAGDIDDALAMIEQRDPDIVFLDVRMPGGDGTELAYRLGPRPVVVFTTAHAEFAVDAFDAGATDYLLKPVALDKLVRALDRAGDRLRLPVPGGAAEPPRITARLGDVIRLFPATAVARFRAEHKYTVFTVDGEEHLSDEPLGALDARLASWGFLRVHRAELIQLGRVRAVHAAGDGAEVELDDGQRARVSRRLLPELRRRLEQRR